MGADQFQFYAPLTFFEKADAAPGQQMRIAGVISTEKLDKQGEIVLQNGLNFDPFLEHGWFNDNHKKGTDDILGYPTAVKKFQKGEILPDGSVADSNGTWAEGWLIPSGRGKKIWELGRDLAKAGNARRLGFSIEGNVQKRTGPGRRTIAKALVRNTAITNCPVGYGTRLECLVKSMDAIEHGEDVDKALTATGANVAPPGVSPATMGPTTGEGAGRIIQTQSLEDDEDDEKKLSKAECLEVIRLRYPKCSSRFAERVYDTLTTLAEQRML